jgi:hypothetical protein
MKKAYGITAILAVFVGLVSCVSSMAQPYPAGRADIVLPSPSTNDLLKTGFKEEQKGVFIRHDMPYGEAKALLRFSEENLTPIPSAPISGAFELHLTNTYCKIEPVNEVDISDTNCIVSVRIIMDFHPKAKNPNSRLGWRYTPAEVTISRVLPADYLNYQISCKEHQHGMIDAQAALVLLSKAKGVLALPSSTPVKDLERTAAYREVWGVCIQTIQKSKDQAAQGIILDEWNKSLKADDDAVPLQVQALAEKWERSLLTEDFWNLLKGTKNVRTVNAMGYVLYQCGIQDDLDRIEKIEKETPGRGLSNTISWLKYRLSGGKTTPEPTIVPPKME